MILESIVSRKRCFLEQQEWKDVLHADDQVSSWILKLGDIFSSLPGIFGDVRELELNGGSASKFRRVFDALTAQLDSLLDWWNEWSSDID